MKNINQEIKDIEFKSFLCDDSDDSNDSDVSIVEIVPPVSMMKTDPNEKRQVKVESRRENIKIKFLVKCKEKNLSGRKVKSMRFEMRQVETAGQAKSKYSIKQVLDKKRLGDLQFMVEGRRLDDEDQVDQLDGKIVMAEGLVFLTL